MTILDTLHRFVRFWTPWPFLDAFGSLKASKKCPKCYKASKSIRTVQIVQEGPNLCNVSKIVKKCPKYPKGLKVKKVYCCFFLGRRRFRQHILFYRRWHPQKHDKLIIILHLKVSLLLFVGIITILAALDPPRRW